MMMNKKKNKLLHLGGPQLQEIAFGLPGAVVEYDPITKNDVFEVLEILLLRGMYSGT